MFPLIPLDADWDLTNACFTSSHQRCSIKEGVLRYLVNFTGKHLRQNLFFNKVAGPRPATLSKETLAQVFSYEFCKISKNTFLTEHIWTAVSAACQ